MLAIVQQVIDYYIKTWKKINLIDLKIDDKRKVFSSKKSDVTFIEIIEEKDNISNFLEIYDKIFEI